MRIVVLGVILSMLPCAAFAQGAGTQAEAQALFDAGRKLMDQGRYGEACPKLEASQKLDPGAGTLLNLASCYEKNGQTASAWVTYTDAATASSASGHADWASKARAHVDALAPHLAKITITMDSPPEGLEVKRDGKAVAYATLGTALPIDPGDHQIEALAPGKIAWSKHIQVKAEGAMEVKIPSLANAASGGGAIAGGGTTDRGGGGGGRRILGLALAGAGVVGIGIGSGLGIDAASKKGVADDPRYCIRQADGKVRCNLEGTTQLDSASTSAAISTVLFVVGGALVVGGIVLFATAPPNSLQKPAPETKAAVRVSPTLGGFVVAGEF